MLQVAVRQAPNLNALAVADLHAALAIVVVVVVMVTVVMITTVIAAVVVVAAAAAAVVRAGQRHRIAGRHFAGRSDHSRRRIMRMMMIRRVTTAVVSI